MTRTDNATDAADYLYLLLADEATHGTFAGLGELTCFVDAQDYCDANYLLEMTVVERSLTDYDLLNDIVSKVDGLLAKSPIRL
jgi:hypothetical protein